MCAGKHSIVVWERHIWIDQKRSGPKGSNACFPCSGSREPAIRFISLQVARKRSETSAWEAWEENFRFAILDGLGRRAPVVISRSGSHELPTIKT